MRLIPDARFVVEVVKRDAAGSGVAITADQMRDPALHKRRADRDAGVGWIVTRDERTVGTGAVAKVRAVWIALLLRAIARDGEAAIILARFGRPADHRDRHEGLCAARAVLIHKLIGG